MSAWNLTPAHAELASEDTKRWTADPSLLATERQHARGESSALSRKVPRPSSSVPVPRALAIAPVEDVSGTASIAAGAERRFVDVALVRSLYAQYAHVVGPAAKLVFETELRALRVCPSALPLEDCEVLLERLTARIPGAKARARFLALAYELFA